MGLPDALDIGLVFRAGNNEREDRAAFMRIARDLVADPVRAIGKAAQIGVQIADAHRTLSDFVAGKVLERGYAVVIGDAFKLEEFDRLGMRARSEHKCEKSGKSSDSTAQHGHSLIVSDSCQSSRTGFAKFPAFRSTSAAHGGTHGTCPWRVCAQNNASRDTST
jgi:hypothetical protein